MSNDVVIIDANVEFSIQIRRDALPDLELIIETLMQSAVNASGRNISGTGFTYHYTQKKSRRGMTIRKANR